MKNKLSRILLILLSFLCTKAVFAQPYPFENNFNEQVGIISTVYKDSLYACKRRTGLLQRSIFSMAKEAGLDPRRIIGVDGHSLSRLIDDKAGADKLVTALERFDLEIRKLERWLLAYKLLGKLKGEKNMETCWEWYGDEFSTQKDNPDWYNNIVRREIIRQTFFFRKKSNDFGPNLFADDDIVGTGPYYSSHAKVSTFSGIKAREFPAESSPQITAGGTLPASKIAASYPLNGQFNFYAHEFNRYEGYLTFREYMSRLNHDVDPKHLWIKWKNTKGEILFNEAYYDQNQLSVFFSIPAVFLETNTLYEFSLVAIDPHEFKPLLAFYAKSTLGELINNEIWHIEVEDKKPKEEQLFKAYFRTSRHQRFFDKIPYQEFVIDEKNNHTYKLILDEPLGQEEVNGLHGLNPLGRYEFQPPHQLKNDLDKLYSNNLAFFLSHPNQDYIKHLVSTDTLFSKIDSIVDIEFLPFSKRTYKYRHIQYEKISKKKGFVFNNQALLPPFPENEVDITYHNIAEQITENDFKTKKVFPLTKSEILAEYRLPSFAHQVFPKIQPIIEKRKVEYVSLLEALDKIKGRTQKYNQGTYQAALDHILPKEIDHILKVKELDIPRGALIVFYLHYSLPGGMTITVVDNKRTTEE